MIIDDIKLRAKKHKKRIILPESMDARVIQAAIQANQENLAKIILIGEEDKILSTYPEYNFLNIDIINPKTFKDIDIIVNTLYDIRKEKGLKIEEAKKLVLNDYMYFACMLVYLDYADGIVSGACHTTSNTLRPALQIIKAKDDVDCVSSFFLMVVPNCEYGDKGVFVFSDAGLVPNPTSKELANIAYLSSKSFELLTNHQSKVAFLSYSTYSSARHELIDKVKGAVRIAHKYYKDMKCDGELQVDAAIDKRVAKMKCPDSKIAGYANTLIFPNLDAGNIGYKLVEKLAKSKSYGPITQGMKKPVNDLSRGCSIEDIIGVIAITSIQCEN